MFNKKSCKNCGSKLNKKYDFCPYCGFRAKGSHEDWGMLGKEDFEYEEESFDQPFLGGINGHMLNKMFNSAMKMLEKEMQKEMKQNTMPKANIRLMINGKEINLNGKPKEKQMKEAIEIKLKTFSEEESKKFAKLPKVEPKTNLRRFSDKLIYELELSEVKSLNDISIMKLENSIEIKAIGQTKAYQKVIPINLPIMSYNLTEDGLSIEFSAKN